MDLAKKPQMAHGDGLKEQVVGASLLGSHLNDAVGLLGNLAQRLALVDGQRERLLAKYVFAGPQGVDGDFCVPVFGRGDGDGVNVLSVEQFAVVFVDRSLAILRGGLGSFAVHIADGDHGAIHGGVAQVGDIERFGRLVVADEANLAVADAAERGPVVFRLVFIGQKVFRRKEVGRHDANGGNAGRFLQKVADA